MYFDITPKTKRTDLFGIKDICDEVEASIRDHRMIVIKGLRRTGKTSIMNIVHNELKYQKLFVDAREIEKGRSATYEYFGKLFYEFIRNRSTIEKAKSYFEGLDVYVKLNFKKKKALPELVKTINSMMEKEGDYFCLFIDEVQLLKPYGFDDFLAFVFDHLKRIKIILAGSEVGVLDHFLGSESSGALYGRPKKEIQLRRFRREESLSFLKKGFTQLDIKISDEEIEKTVDKLDGVAGWLTFYGFYRKELSHQKALSKTLEESSKIVAAELKRFFEVRPSAVERYKLALLGLSQSDLSWVEIKNFIIIKSGSDIPDNRLSNLINQLKEYGFIEEKEGKYTLGDPIIKEALERI